jgi:hypothetical protein
VRKFPTLPLNANGVWIDPTGGVWRQAQATDVQTMPAKNNAENGGSAANAAAPQLPLPDYERYNSMKKFFYWGLTQIYNTHAWMC